MRYKHILIFLVFLFSCANNVQNISNNNYSVINNLADSIKYLGDNWYEVTNSIIIENISPEKAREKALYNAYKTAIEYANGTEIKYQTFDFNASINNEVIYNNFFSISDQTLRGIVLEKNIVEDKTVLHNDLFYKFIKVHVRVDKQKGKRDPSFIIDAHLNHNIFKDGGNIEINLKSTADCYVTVFNICSNDSVYIIFPNKYEEDNFLNKNKILKIPENTDIYFPVSLLSNRDKDAELIKIICTKNKIDFSFNDEVSVYGSYQSSLKKLYSLLLNIPRNEIEECDLEYYIIK